MKVCTCLVLFRIFGHALSVALNSEEESQISANPEDSSAVEESSDENQDSNNGPYTVQSFTKNDKADIKSNLQVIFRAPGLTFTGFIEEIINIINTFKNTTYQDFLRALDNSIRRYHYKGCKFSEVTAKYDTRKFLASTLKMAREQPISVTRDIMNEIADALKTRAYNEHVKELLDYINSLYVNAGETLLSVVDSLEQYKTTKYTKDEIDLGKVIKDGIRKVLFDYYTNLNVNTRRELKNRVDTFWRRFKKDLASRRGSKPFHQSKAMINIRNPNINRNEIKKFKPVTNSNTERNRNLEKKKDFNRNYSTRNYQNRYQIRGSNYKSRGVEPKEGIKYDGRRGPRRTINYESTKKLKTSDPLNSKRKKDSLRRNIDTYDSLLEVDLYQYGGVNSEMKEKQDIKPNTASSETSEEQTHSKFSITFKTTTTVATTKPTPSKSAQDLRRDMEAELMKPIPQISFYLSTNSFKVRQFTLPPALKTHYNFGFINDTTQVPQTETPPLNDFGKDAVLRAHSSSEKDTHVIKRIKHLESQLKKVKNKVSIVNSEVVKIKNALNMNKNDAKGDNETENFGSRDRSDLNTSPTERMVTNEEYTEQRNKEGEEVEDENEVEVTEGKEVSVTKKGSAVTPVFKSKEKGKKKVTSNNNKKKRIIDRNEPQASDDVVEDTMKTSTKYSSEVSMENSAPKATIPNNSNMESGHTFETIAEPVPTKVDNCSQSLNITKTADLNTSVDVNEGRASENYVIKIY